MDFVWIGRHSSELLSLHSVNEEKEGWTLISLLLLVGETKSTIHIDGLAGEDLELVEFADDELDSLSGSLLEVWDTVWV